MQGSLLDSAQGRAAALANLQAAVQCLELHGGVLEQEDFMRAARDVIQVGGLQQATASSEAARWGGGMCTCAEHKGCRVERRLGAGGTGGAGGRGAKVGGGSGARGGMGAMGLR